MQAELQRFAITPGLLRVLCDEIPVAELIGRVRALATQGVDYMLIREKTLAAGDGIVLAKRLRAAFGGGKVLISGRVDIALAAGLDGVHLSAATGELTPAQVRRLLPAALISVSCHTLDEVRRARVAGADAVLFAPVFGKTVDGVEVVAGQGLAALAEAVEAAGPMPVFALGGVDRTNANGCLQAGATGVAGIRIFFPG